MYSAWDLYVGQGCSCVNAALVGQARLLLWLHSVVLCSGMPWLKGSAMAIGLNVGYSVRKQASFVNVPCWRLMRVRCATVQVCGLSGIVALFFTGISHAHYSYYNVTPDAQARPQHPMLLSAQLHRHILDPGVLAGSYMKELSSHHGYPNPLSQVPNVAAGHAAALL